MQIPDFKFLIPIKNYLTTDLLKNKFVLDKMLNLFYPFVDTQFNSFLVKFQVGKLLLLVPQVYNIISQLILDTKTKELVDNANITLIVKLIIKQLSDNSLTELEIKTLVDFVLNKYKLTHLQSNVISLTDEQKQIALKVKSSLLTIIP